MRKTMKALNLLPDDIPEQARGVETIRRLLRNLSTAVTGLAEIRNLYGTGHGRHGSPRGLWARHAKLAAGAASTLAIFLLETHEERA
jgi:Abortive infection C-terminus